MGKKKNGKGSTAGAPNKTIQGLTDKIRNLESRIRDQPPTKASGKKKNKGKKNKPKGESFNPRSLSPFARGFLDPFNARGCRVPDSVLVKTECSTTKWWAGASSGAPSYNFVANTAYVSVIAAPIPVVTAKPLHWSSTPDPTKSFYDYSNNANPGVIDYTKACTDVNVNYVYLTGAVPTGGRSYRVAGGGIKIKFNGIPPSTPVNLYALPLFNGSTPCQLWTNAVAQRLRHIKMKGDDVVVLPWPIRHIGEAFEWIDSNKDGATYTHYPGDDNIPTGVLFKDYATTASTDCSSTNAGIKAWSMQSGMGGWQICFDLPPGAAWSCETIIHSEVIVAQNVPTVYAGDSDTQICFSNERQMEAVCNLVGQTCNREKSMSGGIDTPLSDVLEIVGNKTMNSLKELLSDSSLIDRSLKAGINYALG